MDWPHIKGSIPLILSALLMNASSTTVVEFVDVDGFGLKQNIYPFNNYDNSNRKQEEFVIMLFTENKY